MKMTIFIDAQQMCLNLISWNKTHHHSSLSVRQWLFSVWFNQTSPSVSTFSLPLPAISVHVYPFHIPLYGVFKSQSGPSLVMFTFSRLRIKKLSR